jgi:hypothetical protein
MRVSVTPSLGTTAHTTTPPRQGSPMAGQTNFFIKSWGEMLAPITKINCSVLHRFGDNCFPHRGLTLSELANSQRFNCRF